MNGEEKKHGCAKLHLRHSSAFTFKEYITLKAKDSFKPDLGAEGKPSYNLKESNKTDK